MRRVRSKGMNLERWGELGYKEIDNETKNQIDEGREFHELAEKFDSDKNKLEDAMERVQASRISDEKKADIMAELNEAVDLLQEQYENDVTAEEERIKEEMESQFDRMSEAIDELDNQADSLRGISLDVAATDATAAAEEAERQKQEFITMKNDYTEQYKIQQEQAADMLRRMQARRLSGK